MTTTLKVRMLEEKSKREQELDERRGQMIAEARKSLHKRIDELMVEVDSRIIRAIRSGFTEVEIIGAISSFSAIPDEDFRGRPIDVKQIMTYRSSPQGINGKWYSARENIGAETICDAKLLELWKYLEKQGLRPFFRFGGFPWGAINLLAKLP